MRARPVLRLLFGAILALMLAISAVASLKQPLWQWRGLLSEPDRWWTMATLADAYCGFLTFCAWVLYKERRAAARVGWFVLIMLLGNIAMATYLLLQLARWHDGEPIAQLLLRRDAHGPRRARAGV